MHSATDSLADRLDATVSDRLAEDAEWTLQRDPPDRVTLSLPDRTLVVHRRDGPDGVDHWTLELVADGAIVSKFGPFDTVGAVCDQVRSLLDSDVRYTVCCDG